MRNFSIHYIVSILLVLLFSCNDEEYVPAYADVSILSPVKYAEFEVLDTIMVVIKVGAAQRSVTVITSLRNAAGIPVMPSETIDNANTGSDISIPFVLSDSTLPGGVYNLYAGVFSNSAESGRSVPVYINEKPKKLQRIWFVTRDNNQELVIHVFNPVFEEIMSFTKSGDYAGSAVSSENRLFMIAGSHTGDLVAYNVGDLTEAWRIEGVQNPVQPYFTMVDFNNGMLMVGYQEGFISSYNHSGNVVNSTQNPGITYPDFILATDPFLVSATTQKSNVAQKWLYVNYLQGGALLNSKPVNFMPVGFSAALPGRVMIFGNDQNSKVSTWLLEPISGLITKPYEPFTLPDEKLLTTENISEQVTLLATEEAIYEYVPETSFYRLFNFENADVLKYEPLSELIWLSKHETVFIMDFDGNNIQTLQFDGDLLNLHFLYNR